jgi:hypothetical protein
MRYKTNIHREIISVNDTKPKKITSILDEFCKKTICGSKK